MPFILIENENWGRCRRMRCCPPLGPDNSLEVESFEFRPSQVLGEREKFEPAGVIAVVLKRTVKWEAQTNPSSVV